MRRILLIFLLLLTPIAASGQSVDLTLFGRTGISVGNSTRFNGLRINLRDSSVHQINGLNLTFWIPYTNPEATINGVSVGFIGPRANRLRGVSFGLLGVLGETAITGVSLSTLFTLSRGHIRGINLAGIASVASQGMTGINMAFVALATEAHLQGVNFAGVAAASEENMTGLNVGGLAVAGRGALRGISIGGLTVASERQLTGLNLTAGVMASQEGARGINIGGLALLSRAELRGLNVGGLTIFSRDRITGLQMSGIAVLSETGIRGLTLSGVTINAAQPVVGGAISPVVHVPELHGFGIGLYNRISDHQRGVTIGIFNSTDRLSGVQIGALNIARNNPVPFRVLPVLNLNF